MTLSVGDVAPDFTAQLAHGRDVNLHDMKGQWVLLFFYPRDFTPGCTREACSLNDKLSRFEGLGAAVVGVSSQTQDSHRRFQSHYELEYPLVADTDRSLGDRYGVPIRGPIGKTSARVSFLIDPDGRIAHVWEKVRPDRHAEEVLSTIQSRIS